MTSPISIYRGAYGQGEGKTADPLENKLSGLNNLEAGADPGLLGLALTAAGLLGRGLINSRVGRWARSGGERVNIAARNAWRRVRGRPLLNEAGEVVGNGVDDLAKSAASVSEELARGTSQAATRSSSILGPDGRPLRSALDVADDAVKSAAKTVGGAVDDAARATGQASEGAAAAVKGASTLARTASKLAVPVACAVETGMCVYEGYQVEKKHDAVEGAHAQGLVDNATMAAVTHERNAGEIRIAASGAGGLAASLWAGAAAGGFAAGLCSGGLATPVGIVVGLGAGYFAYQFGSHAAGAAADAITGGADDYRATNQALAKINNLSPRTYPATVDGEETSRAWTRAREKSDYKPALSVPGQSTDPSVCNRYSRIIAGWAAEPTSFQSDYSSPLVGPLPLPRLARTGKSVGRGTLRERT